MYATLSISHTVRNVCACYVSSQQQPGRPGWRVEGRLGRASATSGHYSTALWQLGDTFSTFIDNYQTDTKKVWEKSCCCAERERDCVYHKPARRHLQERAQCRHATRDTACNRRRGYLG